MSTPDPSPPVEMLACLGSGGFGEVYLGRRQGREVAVKVLHHGLDPRSQAVQRLRDEARLLGLLDHPGILRIEDLVLLDGRVALITEYVDGADLEDLLPPRGDLPQAAGVDALQQVATALQAAYTTVDPRGRPLNLLHRDIKPANLRVGRDGRVKLLDFGIAKSTGVTREARTQGASVLGSFAYMAPERFDPRQQDGPAGDVYSLGCVLFEVLAGGAMLLEGYEIRDLFGLGMNRPARDEVIAGRLGTLRVPDAARALVTDMLAWEPAARPDLGDTADRLDQVAALLPGEHLVPWCRGRSWPPAPSASGPLSGRTLDTEVVLRSGGASLPPDALPVGPGEPGRRAAPTTAETLLAVSPADERVDDPDPVGSSGGRSLAVLGAAGLLAAAVLGVVLLGGAALGWLAAGSTPADPPMSAGLAPAPATAPATAPAPATATAPATAPAPAGPGAGGVAPGASGLGVVRPVPMGSPGPRPVPGPVPTGVSGTPSAPDPSPSPAPTPAPASPSAGTCADLEALEGPASAGQLAPATLACLDAVVAGDAPLTQKRKAARVALVDAQVRCARDASCVDYEQRMPPFLEHLDQSSPDVLLPWASHLLRTAEGRDARLRQAGHWASIALENKHVWEGPARVQNEGRLLEIRGRAAYGRWVAANRDEARREEARDALVAWAEHTRSVGHDAADAMDLCASVAGEEACGRRVTTEAVLTRVVFSSRPAGAAVTIDGTSHGLTPTHAELTHGTHQVRLAVGDAVLEVGIEVGTGKPSRWTWVAEDGSWTGAQ